MKKNLLYILMFGSSLAYAFDGDRQYVADVSGVRHVLTLQHWNTNKNGVPSLDYMYKQQSSKCVFQLTGHAIAETEEIKGRLRIIEFPKQDSEGRDLPSIHVYDGDDLSLTLPSNGAFSTAGIIVQFDESQRSRACAKGNEYGLRVSLHK
jgi:hypothetical protein